MKAVSAPWTYEGGVVERSRGTGNFWLDLLVAWIPIVLVAVLLLLYTVHLFLAYDGSHPENWNSPLVADLLVGTAFAEWARRKELNIWIWFFLGATLSPMISFVLFSISTREPELEGLTWQCPSCRGFHEPSTVWCPCGYRPERSSA